MIQGGQFDSEGHYCKRNSDNFSLSKFGMSPRDIPNLLCEKLSEFFYRYNDQLEILTVFRIWGSGWPDMSTSNLFKQENKSLYRSSDGIKTRLHLQCRVRIFKLPE